MILILYQVTTKYDPGYSSVLNIQVNIKSINECPRNSDKMHLIEYSTINILRKTDTQLKLHFHIYKRNSTKKIRSKL